MAEKVLPPNPDQNTDLMRADPSLLVPRSDPTATQYIDQTGETEKGVRPTSKWDLWKDQIWEKLQDEGTESLAMKLIRDVHQVNNYNGTKLTPDQANKLYPGLPAPFKDPVDPVLAQMTYNEFKRRQAFSVWKSRATDLPTGFDLTSGAVSSLIDPVSVVMNYATGGVMKAAGMARGLIPVAAENLVQTAASEAISRSRLASEQQPLSAGESAMNIAAGTMGGVAFHYALGALGSAVGSAKEKAKTFAGKVSPEQARGTIARLIKGAETGQRPSNGRPSGTRMAPEPKAVPGADPVSKFAELDHPSDRTFYLPEQAESGAQVLSTDDFGGTVVYDNPTHARTSVANESGEHGTVRSVDLPEDGNFVRLDSRLDESLASKVAKATNSKELIKEGATLRDVLQAAKSTDKLDATVQALKQEGVSGFTETINTPEGKSNVVHLLDTEKASISDPMSINPEKIAHATEGELNQAQAEQDLPENRRFPPPPERPRAFVDPETAPSEHEAEAKSIKEELAAEEHPLAKELLNEASAAESYDESIPKVASVIAEKAASSDNYVYEVRKALFEKGVQASESDIAEIADALDEVKAGSIDAVDFKKQAQIFLKSEMDSWPAKRKIERLRNAKIVLDFVKIASQSEGGRTSVAQNFLDGVRSGGVRFGYGVNKSARHLALTQHGIWLHDFVGRLGENRRVAESGLLNKEITQELSNIQGGGGNPVSGSKQAFEIAKAMNDTMEDIFATKSGYSPFLQKIENYFYRQSHDRDKIVEMGKEKWMDLARETFTDRNAAGKDVMLSDTALAEVYDDIEAGRYGSSIYDREGKGSNIAFKAARKRSLTPKNWEAFYKYNEAVGIGGPIESMLSMIQSSAEQVGVMSKFGSTPYTNVRRAAETLSRAHPDVATEISKIENKIMDALHYETFAYKRPAEGILQKSLAASQKIETLAKNGGTLLKSFVDFASATTAVTDADGSGYLKNFAELTGSYLKGFLKGSKEASEAALDLGILAESANAGLHLEMGGGSQKGSISKLLEMHSILSGARRGKNAMTFGMSRLMSKKLADMATTPWAELNGYQKNTLLRYGITEKEHSLMKHGVKSDGKYDLFDPGVMQQTFLKLMREGNPIVAGKAPKTLERLPGVVENEAQSAYVRRGSPYYPGDKSISPRTGEGSAEFGKDLSPLPAYNPDSATELAKSAHDLFRGAGYSDMDAGVAATLHSTFFDSVGKAAGLDPKALFDAYKLRVVRENQRPGVAGYFEPAMKAGEAMLSAKRGIPMDKTVIHESAHFFLETLTDVKRMEGLSPEFKKDLDSLHEWLNVKDDNVHIAAHERFVNSFETYLRTNKAPKPELEGFFATVRDWYRRAFESIRRGFAATPFSLSKAERAPQHIENFYRKLMGGEGPAEVHGALSYASESVPENILYAGLNQGRVERLPTNLNDLILKTGAIINDSVETGTTTAGSKQMAQMYGRDDGTSIGALRRLFWQFKSSTMRSADTLQRTYFSNPNAPQGDLTKVARFMLLSAGLYTIQHEAQNALMGKTPESPATPEYFAKALVNSGAGSVWADTIVNELFASDRSGKFSTGLMRSLSPTVTAAFDIADAGQMATRSIFDETTKFPGRDVGKAIADNFPFQNIFYTNALLHFYFLNGIRESFGPGFLGTLENSVNRKPGMFDETQQYWALKPSESLQWLGH
jgi:hypothetical protein